MVSLPLGKINAVFGIVTGIIAIFGAAAVSIFWVQNTFVPLEKFNDVEIQRQDFENTIDCLRTRHDEIDVLRDSIENHYGQINAIKDHRKSMRNKKIRLYVNRFEDRIRTKLEKGDMTMVDVLNRPEFEDGVMKSSFIIEIYGQADEKLNREEIELKENLGNLEKRIENIRNSDRKRC